MNRIAVAAAIAAFVAGPALAADNAPKTDEPPAAAEPAEGVVVIGGKEVPVMGLAGGALAAGAITLMASQDDDTSTPVTTPGTTN